MGALSGAQSPGNCDLADVIQRCTPMVSGICHSRLRGRPFADIEEAIQETFTRLVETDVSSIVNIEAWLIRVALNVCAQTLRHKYRRPEELTADVPPSFSVSDGGMFTDAEERVFLATIGTLLPTTDVKLMHLLYVQDLPYGEVAKALGISNEAARARALRARQRACVMRDGLQ